MRSVALAALTGLGLLAAGPVQAGPYVDNLVACMLTNASAADREAVLERMSLALIKPYDKAKSDAADKREGEVIVRLATKVCLSWTQGVIANEGEAALNEAPYLFRKAVIAKRAAEVRAQSH